ncbi:FAD-dependent oxidoreductase [Enterococcus sp. AZ103]|uniref:FAD-dependent oxidoreductase n=1 Tax=Enterococcus sp. AZ103 TaxID=2774628 RepID=UPI003F68424D
MTPCLRCTNCLGGKYDGHNECDVNPIAGNELYTLRTPNVVNHKRVLVIGGGPGGMKAAITAAKRGHQVTLVEKEAQLGGNLKFTDIDAHKDDLRRFKDYLIRQLAKNAVEVKLNTEANLALVKKLNPQAIIVASGATPVELKLPGSDKFEMIHATEVYQHPEQVGKKAIMIGGGLMGCEVALHLAEAGVDVTVLKLQTGLAVDSNRIHQAALFEMMDKMADLVHSQTQVQVTEVTESGVTYLDAEGQAHSLEADTVIYAVGMKPNEKIVEEIRSWDGWESFMPIGDCTGASVVRKAVHTGYYAAMDII